MLRPPLRAAARLIALLALAGSTAHAQTDVIQRCESKDGRVTYSNGACPDGTVAIRKVNTAPPISVDDQKAAQERTRRDAAAARQIDEEQAAQAARERRQADERAKADARTRTRCDDARRQLDKARAARSTLNAQPATVDKLQKAEQEIARRESDAERECGR